PPAVTVSPPPRPAAPPARLAGPPPELGIGQRPAGLDAKRWDGLRRGKLRPERKLDLHGMRAAEAHAAVQGFLTAAQAQGLRCVCIVTGKGSSEEGGTLRRELPHWLNAPALRGLVLGAAHPHKANTGAVHLLLRRRRA
ncbi:MAG: Smr/MutS family protein, partial [Acetobacteraceae bacterium]|nr:Smr/MutS family protein [Acetobacteraceae bacterium]